MPLNTVRFSFSGLCFVIIFYGEQKTKKKTKRVIDVSKKGTLSVGGRLWECTYRLTHTNAHPLLSLRH